MRSPVVIIGLDCAAPELLFERFIGRLPNISALMGRGLHGPLRSVDPPITVPAWACMTSGMDPGQLGLYGFRNRKGYGYDALGTASSADVRFPRLWDMAHAAGMTSVALGVPLTWPATPLRGAMVAGFPLPPGKDGLVQPRSLGPKLERWAGGPYIPDAEGFRNTDRAQLVELVETMVKRRFAVAKGLWRQYRPEFMMMVEMGPDRMHHAFWRYMDPRHRLYEPDSPFAKAIEEHYATLDREIGALLDILPPETLVLIVSDHGARRMEGALCINQWLIDKGLLVLKEPPEGPKRLSAEMVDWPKTKVWSDGGYYARIFCNVAGREPQGVIPPEELDGFLAWLRAHLEAMPGPDGSPLGNRVIDPRQAYAARQGAPPELMLYPGDLAWRAVGTVWPGQGPLFTFENDIGPDDANHAPDGVLIAALAGSGPLPGAGGVVADARLLDVCPSVCAWLGLEAPQDATGRPWPWLGC